MASAGICLHRLVMALQPACSRRCSSYQKIFAARTKGAEKATVWHASTNPLGKEMHVLEGERVASCVTFLMSWKGSSRALQTTLTTSVRYGNSPDLVRSMTGPAMSFTIARRSSSLGSTTGKSPILSVTAGIKQDSKDAGSGKCSVADVKKVRASSRHFSTGSAKSRDIGTSTLLQTTCYTTCHSC